MGAGKGGEGEGAARGAKFLHDTGTFLLPHAEQHTLGRTESTDR